MMQAISPSEIASAIGNLLEDESCKDFHPGISCEIKSCHQFLTTLQSCSKMYLLVHLVPFLLFKRKKIKLNPLKEFKKLMIAFIKSMLFAAGYTAIVRRVTCGVSSLHKFVGYSNAIAAVVAGVTLNFQPTGRQAEIALYCLNNSIDLMYNMARRRNYPVKIAYGECWLMATSIAVIAYHFMNNPEAIRESYHKLLAQILANI